MSLKIRTLKTTAENLYIIGRNSKGMNWQSSQVVGLIILVFISAVYIALLGSTTDDAQDTTSCTNPMIQGLDSVIAETTDAQSGDGTQLCN